MDKEKIPLCGCGTFVIPILEPIFNGMMYDPKTKIIQTSCSDKALGKSVKGKIVWFRK